MQTERAINFITIILFIIVLWFNLNNSWEFAFAQIFVVILLSHITRNKLRNRVLDGDFVLKLKRRKFNYPIFIAVAYGGLLYWQNKLEPIWIASLILIIVEESIFQFRSKSREPIIALDNQSLIKRGIKTTTKSLSELRELNYDGLFDKVEFVFSQNTTWKLKLSEVEESEVEEFLKVIIDKNLSELKIASNLQSRLLNANEKRKTTAANKSYI